MPKGSAESVMTTHAAGSTTEPASDGTGRHWLANAAHQAFPVDEESHGASGFAACALSDDPQVTAEARDFTRTTLRGWGMGPLTDNAAIIVSELISNALRYGVRGPRGRTLSAHPVWLGLLRRGDLVLCAVSDPGTDIPVVREPDYFAESGRGLHVIDTLSDSWGWTTPDHVGKAVWAVVSRGC
jgi:anti-sigma regulatory factor (Ser/Thr protein kinase)